MIVSAMSLIVDMRKLNPGPNLPDSLKKLIRRGSSTQASLPFRYMRLSFKAVLP